VYIAPVSSPADLGVVEAAASLARRVVSSVELVSACLERIRQRDGEHSFEGSASAVNAWVRVYEEDALDAAARADSLRARGLAGALCGIPIGLKDLYGVAGKPLTASSRVLDDVPARHCEAWARLEAAGMVLLGHLHTHEFAAGGTTDQVGNPHALDRSAGGSSGGSAAALASMTTPAATGTDTAGSLRIPSALCGTATIKPTRGIVPLDGIVPLSPSFDHAGPMARTVADCEPLFAALASREPPEDRRPLRRVALSPRIAELDSDVAAGFERALARLPVVSAPPPDVALDLGRTLLDVLTAEMLAYHRRFDDRRALYRPSVRGFLEYAEQRALQPEEHAAAQRRRPADASSWIEWLDANGLDAIVEPTGYDAPFTDFAEISLTHYWNWTGFPVVALPADVGSGGLPVGVSLVGRPGSDWDLLAAGASLQAELS
jgi:aspartyl-tRNA(Asn)/glutamyl-tRNA(Gln) amidotransferase subunit A